MERQRRHLRVVQNVRPMRHVRVAMVPHMFVTVARTRPAVGARHVHGREHRLRVPPVYRHAISGPVHSVQMTVDRTNTRPTVIIDDLHQIFSSENCFMRVLQSKFIDGADIKFCAVYFCGRHNIIVGTHFNIAIVLVFQSDIQINTCVQCKINTNHRGPRHIRR